MNTLQYFVVGAFFGVICLLYIIKQYKRYKIKKRLKRAKTGESKAISLLKKQGFEILELQKENYYNILVDNKPYKASVKADMIVKKRNKIYVVEVKTGKKAPSPKLPATRRQLLEYYMVYKPDGLLLVDMEQKKIKSLTTL